MEYGPSSYGDSIADRYDYLYENLFDTEATVTLLASYARGGRALELGIGTGRIALPLVERGVEVEGVDSSEAMVAKLRAKSGGDKIKVTFGNFVDPPVEGPFDLVYVPFNTLFALTTQEEQITCFANVARLLTDEGVFVLDAFVPDPTRFDRHQRVSVENLDDQSVMLDATINDPKEQRSTSYHVMLSPDGIEMHPVIVRYAWPSELDLMARLAGLQLSERWGSYRCDPFTSESASHVSVYERGS
jgi:SAM-dependent methyltransferase